MIDLLVLIAIGAAIFFIWVPRKEKESEYQTEEKKLFSLKPGSIIKINQAGENLEDLDLKVLAKNLYTQGSYDWIEYELTSGTQKYWLTVESDDQIELSFTFYKSDLKELGTSKAELKKIDDQETGKITYQGADFYYQDSDGAVFFKNSNQALREEFYYWEFEDQAGEYFISLENWSNSYEVSFGKYIEERQIQIYN